MLASQLITDAFNLSGIVGEQFQSVSTSQSSRGLKFLNDVLKTFFLDKGKLPYYSVYDFNFVANQQSYFIENLVQLDTLTYFLGNGVRISMQRDTRDDFFGASRVENVSSLPYLFRTEPEKGGLRIFLYFLPSQDYPAQLTGRFSFELVIFSTELDTFLDGFYQVYLSYKLAEKICNYYMQAFSPDSRRELDRLEQLIEEINLPDVTAVKSSSLRSHYPNNWAEVNLAPRGGFP